MRPDEYLSTYQYFSSKTSDVARAAALGGLGVIWLFRGSTAQSEAAAPALPSSLLLPTVLLGLSVAIDLLHYLVGSAIWRHHFKNAEREAKGGRSYAHRAWWNLPIDLLFALKLLLIAAGYACLSAYALRTLFAPPV